MMKKKLVSNLGGIACLAVAFFARSSAPTAAPRPVAQEPISPVPLPCWTLEWGWCDPVMTGGCISKKCELTQGAGSRVCSLGTYQCIPGNPLHCRDDQVSGDECN